MAQHFTTPCFVRFNTSFLREFLRNIGYADNFGEELNMGKQMIFAIPGVPNLTEPCYECTDHWHGNRINDKIPVDCGRNADMFEALAALRSDSDFMQYFKANDNTGDIVLCLEQTFDASRYEVDDFGRRRTWSKMTVNDIIKHFKYHADIDTYDND